MAKAKKQSGGQKPASRPEVPVEPRRDRFSFTQWAIINVVFLLFCLLQFFVVQLLFKETLGMRFFFTCIVAAFVAVSLFVWAHDQFYRDEDDEF